MAATHTFFFSFTSFALVKWLAPSSNTLESMLGEMGGTAGIAGYRVETSLAVLSIATFQMLLMLVMLILAGRFERQRHSQVLSMHHETKNRERHGPASRRWTFFVNGILVLLLAPLISVIASFQVRTIGPSGATSQWTVEGWKRAWSGDFSTVPLLDALTNSSQLCCVGALCCATAWLHCRNKFSDPANGGIADWPAWLIRCAPPLSMSAVMVGLGMVAHSSLVSRDVHLPLSSCDPPHDAGAALVIRLMVPAIERIDPIYAEQASLF